MARKMSRYRQIGFLMDAGADVNPDEYLTHPERIEKLLTDGVTYKDKKKRFWVDSQGCTCFEIFARGLDITNGDRTIYWQWKPDSDGIEVAKALKARWLEVKGSFWTMDLTPGTHYKVSFRTSMDEAAPVSSMAGQPVNLRLSLPDGTNRELPAVLPQIGQCHELEVGSFTLTPQNVGKMEFSMKKSFGDWMGGLVIEGVEIKPA